MHFDPESYNQERFHAPFVFRKTVFIEPFNLFKSQRNSWFRLLKSKVTVTVIEKLMNPVSNVSSRQGSMPHLEEEGKNQGVAGTEELPKGVAGGRNVSPVAGANVFAASAERDASVAKSNDRRTLSCREPKQQVALKAGSSAIPVDGADTERVQSLMNKLGIIDRLLGGIGDKEQMQVIEYRTGEMHVIQRDALNMLGADAKLADERLDPVFEYVEESGDVLTANNLCRSKALVLNFRGDFANALLFFKKARELDGNNITINFSESMLAQHLMLGIVDASSEIQIDLFDPEGFYNEIQRWLSDGKVREEDVEKSLESEFMDDKLPVVKIFRNAIKAIFAEEDILAAGRVKCFIDELDRFEKTETETLIMMFLSCILEFAMNLRLIEQDRFDEALKNINLTDHDVKYLGEYIRCQVLRKTGKIDQAIEKCK